MAIEAGCPRRSSEHSSVSGYHLMHASYSAGVNVHIPDVHRPYCDPVSCPDSASLRRRSPGVSLTSSTIIWAGLQYGRKRS